MSLITEENDAAVRASHIDPRIDPGAMSAYHPVIYKDDRAAHPFCLFYKFFEISGYERVIVVLLAQLKNVLTDVLIGDQEKHISLSFGRTQCLQAFQVSTRS